MICMLNKYCFYTIINPNTPHFPSNSSGNIPIPEYIPAWVAPFKGCLSRDLQAPVTRIVVGGSNHFAASTGSLSLGLRPTEYKIRLQKLVLVWKPAQGREGGGRGGGGAYSLFSGKWRSAHFRHAENNRKDDAWWLGDDVQGADGILSSTAV